MSKKHREKQILAVVTKNVILSQDIDRMETNMPEGKVWQCCRQDVFWNNSEHALQLYEDDAAFMNVLTGFVGTGIKMAHVVVIIATTDHLRALDKNLLNLGLHLEFIKRNKLLVMYNANELLSTVCEEGILKTDKISGTVETMMAELGEQKRPIRIFGEMVGLLISRGHLDAALSLENIWEGYRQQYGFDLFCAYHNNVFAEFTESGKQQVIQCHSSLVSATNNSMAEINYRRIN